MSHSVPMKTSSPMNLFGALSLLYRFRLVNEPNGSNESVGSISQKDSMSPLMQIKFTGSNGPVESIGPVRFNGAVGSNNLFGFNDPVSSNEPFRLNNPAVQCPISTSGLIGLLDPLSLLGPMSPPSQMSP